MRALALVGRGDHHGNIGVVAIGDEGLVAIQHIAVAFFHGGGARIAGVRARSGLGQSPRGQPLAAGQLRDVFLLLRLVSGEKDVVGAQRVVRRNDDADRAVHSREFFNRQNIIDIAETRAAILRREDDAQQAHLAKLLHDLSREFAGLVPLHHVGRNLARGEIANLATKMFLLLRQHKGIQAWIGFERNAHVVWLLCVPGSDASLGC